MRSIYVDKIFSRMLAVKVLKPIWPGVSISRLAPVRFADMGEPELPGPRWLRVKNLVCGICGTDISLLQVDVDLKVAPACLPGSQRFYLGHEVVSVVTEVGPGVTRFKVGDRVVMDSRFQGATCLSLEIEPVCRYCQEGNYQLCESASVPGVSRGYGGGWGDGYVAHESEVYPVPDDISDEQAAMIEPLSVGVRSVLRRMPQEGDQVLVVGAGIIGLTVVQTLRALVPGVHISVMARYPHQAAAALSLGASSIIGPGDDVYQAAVMSTEAKLYTGMLGNRMLLGGFDTVYDCVGSAKTLTDSLRLARAEGTVVMAGIKLAPLKIDWSPIWFQEVDLIGVYAHGTENWQGQQRHTYAITIDLLRSGQLEAESLITHRFKLEQWQDAVRTAMDKQSKSIKVVFDYRD